MYVVTGVSGQFGRAAAELLLERVPGDQVILTTRDVEGALAWAGASGAQVRHADYDDLELTTEAFRGGDVLLLVSTTLVGPLRRAQHERAVQAARDAGVGRIVYTSYLGSGNPQQEAMVTIDHRATEQAILASGLSWNFLRDSQYGEALAEQVATATLLDGVFTANQGEGRGAFVSRGDCVRVAVALLLGAGERDTAYDVTGPELLTYRDVAAMIAEISGRDIPYADLTDEEFYAYWDRLGVPRSSDEGFEGSPFPWCSDDMVSFGRGIRLGEMDVISDTVERLTGRPPVSLRELMLHASPTWPSATSPVE